MVQMSTVWDRTTAFAAGAIAAILPVALLLLFLPIAIQVALTPLLVAQSLPVRIVVMALFWAIELSGTLSLMALALSATPRPGDAVRAAMLRLGPTIAIFIFLLVVAGLLIIPIHLVMAGAGIDFASLHAGHAIGIGNMTAAGAWFILGYGLLLIIAGIWVTARLLVIEPVILVERRGIGAVMQAFRLTRGLALRIIGALILYGLVSTVAILAVQTVCGSIFVLVAPADSGLSLAAVLTSIAVAAVSTAFKVIAAIFIAKLYIAVDETRGRTAEAV